MGVGEVVTGEHRVGGRYRLERVLGEGSVARTYLALDEEGGQRVAVKIMHPSRTASVNDFERFRREAEALASLDHAGIPRYVDHFEGDDRTYCLVQQWVDGESLEASLRREPARWKDRAALVELAIALLDIVAHLSEREPPVVHRDIKPANILITPQGAVRLVDFGGVREAVRETIRAGSTVIGTYGFMPPEQLMGRPVPASDLFAIGITLVALLTGRPADALSSDGFTVDLAVLDLPEDDPLRRFIAGLTQVHLDDRYASVSEAFDDAVGLRTGRAPQYADRLARRAALRRQQLANEARRRLLAGKWTLLTLLFLSMGGAFVGAFAFVLRTLLATEFDAAIVGSLLVTLPTLFVATALLAGRYRRDEWVAPTDAWDRTIGTVRSFGGHGNIATTLRLEFELEGQTQLATLPTSRLDAAWGGLRRGMRLGVRFQDGGRRGLEVEGVPLDLPDERIPIRPAVAPASDGAHPQRVAQILPATSELASRAPADRASVEGESVESAGAQSRGRARR